MMVIILGEYSFTIEDDDNCTYLESMQSQLMIMIILREYSVTIDDGDYIKRVLIHN